MIQMSRNRWDGLGMVRILPARATGAGDQTHSLDRRLAGTLKKCRVSGSGDLWITEYILTYDGKPSYTVSIMEFSGDKVARETQYFADPFEAGAWRAQWVERMGEGEVRMPRK